MSSIGGAFPNNRVSLAWINDLAKTAPEELVSCSEAQFEGQLDQVVGHLNQLDPTPQVVALAGPSSSGKTTCAHKLCSRLTRRGIPCQRISLDDFYLGDGRYPLRADGSADVESIESLDLAAFHRCMVELLETGSTLLPVFDFVARQPAAQGRLCRLPPNGIVVVEGLHALNPRLAEAIPPERLYRLFVHVGTTFFAEGVPALLPEEDRLIRRLVRDFHHRNHGAAYTLQVWSHVMEGERVNIEPFRSLADGEVDSTLWYEPCVLHHFLGPIVAGMDRSSPLWPRMEALWQALERFDDLPKEIVPQHSLLQEFMSPV